MNPRSVVKKLIPRQLFGTVEPYGHLAEAILLNTLNGYPARGMKVIGVTGTNGKTTTCFMIHRMLREAGYSVGLITTVAYGVNDDIRPQLTHMTTPTVPELMKRLKYMRSEGVDWLVLETTSQALAQHRVWGVPYSIAVFTNLTHEHLTYHRTFERYRTAKVRLFKMANRNRRGKRLGIVNSDDPNGKYFAQAIKNARTYGIAGGDLKASKIHNTSNNVTFDVKDGKTTYHLTSRIPGTFNVYNALAALCVGQALHLDATTIEKGIASLQGVEGRMTRIDEGQDFTLIVDYAHTPDSFEKLFSDLKPMAKAKILAVFGSLGGGDKGKRPIQGELAGRFADEVVICEEDDRKENPDTIMEDIAVGAEKTGKVRDKDLFLVHDRTKAIILALSHAHKGDIVLLLGKGHEKTIERADGEHPWNEIETARRLAKLRARS